MSSHTPTPALPKGSLILVTGASGHIGSNVVYEALEAGYKVRGTARSHEKAERTKKTFNNHPDYSTAIVEDFQHEGAFDEAVQGVDAVIHVASDVTFSTDADKVIQPVVRGVLSIARSAAKTPSVKRFVLTSSSAAALTAHADKEVTVTADTWNEEALDITYNHPDAAPGERALAIYSASKTEGEQALWKFVREEQPRFVVNTILPNFNMGRVIDSPGATGGSLIKLYRDGELIMMGPQFMIDVVDDARLHVIAAALDGGLRDERVFAFNVAYNNASIIAAMKKLYPDHKGLPEPPKEGQDLSKIPNELGAELLRKWYGQDGYKPLEQTIRENLAGVAK